MNIVYEWREYDQKPEVLVEMPTPYIALLHLRSQQALIKSLEREAETEKERLHVYERQLVRAQEYEDAKKAAVEEALKAIRERGD